MRGLVVPEPSEDFTADPVELFFDLAFVFAFSQLVSRLVHHPTWDGAMDTGLLFVILWLAWSTFTWSANVIRGNSREIRAIFLFATAASVPMGASVRTAYGSGGATFAACASAILVVSIGLQLWGVRSVGTSRDEFRAILRFVTPNVLATAFLIAGGLLDGGARKILWAIFVVAIVRGIVVARFGNRSVRPGHFAERHGLIVIIALGEIIVAIGISVVNSLDDAAGLPGDTLIGLCAAGALAGILWWGYFDRVVPALEHHGASLEGREQSTLVADVYTGLHMPIVAGIIAAAAATEEILLHPTRPIPTAFLLMFLAGCALYYGGISLAAHRAFKVVAKERLFAIAAVTLLAIVGRDWDGIVLLVAVDAALLVGIAGEHVRIEPHMDASALPGD